MCLEGYAIAADPVVKLTVPEDGQGDAVDQGKFLSDHLIRSAKARVNL